MDFGPLFQKVADAIDHHPDFVRTGDPEFSVAPLPCGAGRSFTFASMSYCAKINVRCGRNKGTVYGSGTSFEAAAVDLIGRLDHWAEAIG